MLRPLEPIVFLSFPVELNMLALFSSMGMHIRSLNSKGSRVENRQWNLCVEEEVSGWLSLRVQLAELLTKVPFGFSASEYKESEDELISQTQK